MSKSDAGTPGSRGGSQSGDRKKRTRQPLSPLRRSPRLRMLHDRNYELGDNESCGNDLCTGRETFTTSIPAPMQQVSTIDVGSSRSSLAQQLRPTSRECEGDVSEFGDHLSERESGSMNDFEYPDCTYNLLRHRGRSLPPMSSGLGDSSSQYVGYNGYAPRQRSMAEGVRQIAHTVISWNTVITSLVVMLLCAVNFADTDSCCQYTSVTTLFIVAIVNATRRFIIYMLTKYY